MAVGNPPPQDQGYPQQQPMVRPDGSAEPSQQELDQAFPPQQQPGEPQQPPPRRRPPPQPQSTTPGDPAELRPQTT
jgi:penicillin-binding protein 1A